MAEQVDFKQEVAGAEVTVLPIAGKEYVTVADAVEISPFSRTYINKLLNGKKIAGMNTSLGWLVEIESLGEFAASNRRAPGRQTMLDQALKAFLDEIDPELFTQWEEVRKRTIADYDEQRKAAKNGDESETAEEEVAE